MSSLEMKVNALMRLCTAERETDRRRVREELRVLMEIPGQQALDPELEIQRIMLELGAPEHLVGHPYVVQGILLVVSNRAILNNITFGLYPQLAAQFNTTAARVERAIRNLIEVTWARGDVEAMGKYFGNTVSAVKGKPTNSEFIARIANVVKQRMREAA